MKKSNASAVRIEALDLQFPDWSGMERSSGRLGVDAAFDLCEQYLLWFPKPHYYRRHQRREKCAVEFTL
jgi:hypothetical protein